MTKPRGPETLWTLTAEAEHLARLAKELHSQAESLAYDAADVGKKAGRLHDRLDCYAREHDPAPDGDAAPAGNPAMPETGIDPADLYSMKDRRYAPPDDRA